MEDASFHTKYRATPQPNLTFEHGPWLKPTVATAKTALSLRLGGTKANGTDRARVVVQVTNTGTLPAFPVEINIDGVKRSFYATDNFFWLAPGERREITLEVLWRDPALNTDTAVTASAWNAAAVRTSLVR